jgi:hypothetical protein
MFRSRRLCLLFVAVIALAAAAHTGAAQDFASPLFAQR